MYFDTATGLLAAAFWATGVNAIALNRVAKEDTLVVCFMLFAFYFYVQAKTTPRQPPEPKRRWYMLSGASFGLLMASKYFPHYFALNMLHHHIVKRRNAKLPAVPGRERRGGPAPLAFYVALALAFFAANPAHPVAPHVDLRVELHRRPVPRRTVAI